MRSGCSGLERLQAIHERVVLVVEQDRARRGHSKDARGARARCGAASIWCSGDMRTSIKRGSCRTGPLRGHFVTCIGGFLQTPAGCGQERCSCTFSSLDHAKPKYSAKRRPPGVRAELCSTVICMEPVTHILTGAVLARAGLNRKAAYMTVAMAIAAEFPDIDTVWSALGPVTGFEHHRGHNPHAYRPAGGGGGADGGVLGVAHSGAARRRKRP